jgi:hypothetical protein
MYSAPQTTALAVGFSFGSMTAGLLAICQGTFWTTLSVRAYFLMLTTLYLPALWLVLRTDVTAISLEGCDDGSEHADLIQGRLLDSDALRNSYRDNPLHDSGAKLSAAPLDRDSDKLETFAEFRSVSGTGGVSTNGVSPRVSFSSRPHTPETGMQKQRPPPSPLTASEDGSDEPLDCEGQQAATDLSRLTEAFTDFGSDNSNSFSQEPSSTYSDRAFVTKYCAFLALQVFNASLAYGAVPSLISFTCGRFRHAQSILLFSTAS